MKKFLFYCNYTELLLELNYFLKFLDNLNINFKITKNLEYAKQFSDKKIAIVDYWQTDEQYHLTDYQTAPDLSWADLVIFITTECIFKDTHEEIKNLSKLINNQNTISIIGGINKDDSTWKQNERVFFPFFNFFYRTTMANDPIVYSDDRKFLFDCLLGSKKPERVELVKTLINYNLDKKSLISIYDSPHNPLANKMIDDYQSKEIDNLEDPWVLAFKEKNKNNLEQRHSGFFTEKLYPNSNIPIQMCCIISPKIYQNSWFTIASETTLATYFFTEKVAKPLFAKRIFVILASQGYLKFLRSFGFKTFDGIIDESYDNELDPEIKIKKIQELILWLSEQNPIDLYKRAEPILEHNYQLITGDFWRKEISKFIKSHIGKL